MSLVSEWLSAPEWEHLAVALLHNLWQAVIVAGILYLVLKSLPASRGRLRYILALTAQVCVLFCGIVTWSWLNYEADESIAEPAVVSASPVVDTNPVKNSEVRTEIDQSQTTRYSLETQ